MRGDSVYSFACAVRVEGEREGAARYLLSHNARTERLKCTRRLSLEGHMLHEKEFKAGVSFSRFATPVWIITSNPGNHIVRKL